MLTNQVRDLTSDLSQIARKYEGGDLTKAAVVELFASEACSIINPTHPDPALEPVLRHLQRAVEITAGMPQTVDVVAEPVSPERKKREVRARLMRSVDDAVEEAGDHFDRGEIVEMLLRTIQVVLHPDDNPILPQYQRAYQFTKEVLSALDNARREADLAREMDEVGNG